MEQFRICANKKCEHKGIAQPIENFYMCGRDRKSRKRICIDCVLKYHQERYLSERIKRLKYAKIIADDDQETDLMPMEHGGFVRWAVISTERRIAHGELAPYSGVEYDED